MPLVYASVDAYEPLCANTVASTATPSTPPSSRIAFVAPDAWPASSGCTLLSTALAAGANTSAMPVPAMMNGITSSPYGTVGLEMLASHPIAPACSVRPVTISGRDPIRSDSSPAIGAMNIGMIVQGSVRSPASSGE